MRLRFMNLIIITLMFLLSTDFLFSGKVSAEQMKKVQWLLGNWKGEGWAMAGPGGKQEFMQEEIVTSKLDGLLFTIEGFGKQPKQGKGEQKVIHHAFAFLFYDVESSAFKMRAFNKMNGSYTDSDVTIDENGRFIWGFEYSYAGRSGKMRFTITHTPKGEWHEIGEMSRDGGNTWFKYLEMRLQKTSMLRDPIARLWGFLHSIQHLKS